MFPIVMTKICAMQIETRTSSLPEIKTEKYILSNGLSVVLCEDHSIPVVSVNVWYHVGSKNEKAGRTGFAHLFEHMMFQGSQHSDEDYFVPLEKVGAVVNGSTSEDRTNYHETLPSNYLELALWLESDRMGFLLPALTQKKLDNQRDVVKNERRQRLENQPYGKVYDLLPSLSYPKDHPYSWPVIGSMADLTAASVEDVSEFFRDYYTPNNAFLCITGDFDSDQTKKWIEKYFGTLPPGPPIDRLETWMPELDGIRRAQLEDNVELPRLYYVWHTPAQYVPGDAELDLLANVLTSGKTSRLYKALVYEQQIAQDVTCYQASQELCSTFNIEVTARAGHTLEELEQAVDEELKKIFAHGVTAEELKQAQNVYEAGYLRGLQSIEDLADTLNGYTVMLGDPNRLQWDLERYTSATTADIQKFAKDYIKFDKRVILHVVPQGKLTAEKEVLDRSKQPVPAPEPAFNPPSIQRSKLSNGVEIFLVEDHKLPLVQINMVFQSGWAEDPVDRPGAASLTAELLDEGTKTRTALQISEEAKGLGASLGTGSSFDGSSVRLNVLKKTLDQGLDLMSDVLLNPTFPAEELERQRKIYLGRIQQEAKDPTVSAFKLFLRTLYGPVHPYGQPYTGSGTQASIQAIQRNHLLQYYNEHYVPNNAALAIAGDITMQEVISKFEKQFVQWKPGKPSRNTIPPPEQIKKIKIYLVDKPVAAQSVVVVGNPALQRNNPDFVALDVMNNILGGQFQSRINLNLREEKGYTYGAGSFVMTTRGIGPFVSYASVQTPNTKESIVELLKEIKEIQGIRPVTSTELQDSKDNIIKGIPQNFQSYSSIAGQLGQIFIYGLPEDEWTRYIQEVNTVTIDEATQAARKYLHPDALLIVVVGDRKQVEPGIRELNLGEISHLSSNAI
jgi:zinc protease